MNHKGTAGAHPRISVHQWNCLSSVHSHFWGSKADDDTKDLHVDALCSR